MLAVIVALALITGIVIFSTYASYKAPRRAVVKTVKRCIGHPVEVIDVAFNKIGGWFNLWLVTASILSWQIIAGLIGVLPPVSGKIWAMANDPMSRGYAPLLKVLLLFTLTGRTLLIYVGGLIGIDFVRRSHYIPKLVVGFLLAYLIILVTEQVLLREFIKPLQMFLVMPWNPFRLREFVTTIIACLIWVPYFLFSKRVGGMFKIGASPTNGSPHRSLTEVPKPQKT